MPLPVVAIIGRPNVGKSAIVNRLAKVQEAIVYDQPGVTRDRTYKPAFWSDRDFMIVDTGGLVFDDETEFLPLIREQAMMALSEACAAIFVVDGQEGLTEADRVLSDWLHRQHVPVVLAVNKCESLTQGYSQVSEFYELGWDTHAVSGIHGNGLAEALDDVLSHFPEKDEEVEEEEIRVAIIGRPNVGKSSLLNAIAGENRSIVSPISGTTRDAIDLKVERNGIKYRLVDTAGIRKKKYVQYGPEFFGINRAFKAIDRADVVLLVIDAVEGVTDQDQKLAGRILEEGRACIVVMNKWDAIEEKDTYTMLEHMKQVKARLHFTEWADVVFTSAVSGQRVEKIFDMIAPAAEQHRRRVSTSVINEILEDAVSWHTPPTMKGGKQGRIYYGTQVSSRPPSIALFVNSPDRFGDTYRRYIERKIRESLGFQGTPIRIFWRGKKTRELDRGANKAIKVKS
ncbi:ribosome biogenesis GTPase Der [filamentous cyanobacterium LEGE 11480]|uniref:GTPase Der n=1 Tax=Romeriopsis navalis LEGE 11480 TaxID=2777977 RepID=A0A928VQ19_9CYAN|nr:ribosome biogenesis GTPase Der [Romeriopsis navalis]MBE9032668.1 ribosome biogenesis GTPase Der [Romeriopsis navalis LEGE 11480]